MIAERIENDFRTRTASSGSSGTLTGPLPQPAPRPLPRRDTYSDAQPVVRPGVRASVRPMAHRGPLVVRHVRALGWRSPETLAVLVASFVVSLAALYVAAYARVAADGLEESRLTHASRLADERKDMLLARVSELSLASDVQKTAGQMKMVGNDEKSAQLLLDAAPVTAAVAAAASVNPPAAVLTASQP